LALLAYNAIQCSLYGLFGVVVAGLIGGPWWGWALVGWAAVAVFGLLHVSANAKVLAMLLACEIAVVILFDLAAFWHPAEGTVGYGPLLPTNLVQDGVGGVFGLSVAAFVGYESALAYGEEARNHRSVARATFGSLVFIGLLYAVSSWAVAVAVGPDRVVDAARDPASGIPIGFIADHYGPYLAILASLLLVTSVFAAMLSFHHTAARYVFVLGRERVLPASLGRVGRGGAAGAPVGGSLLQSGVALVVILVCAGTGADPLAVLFTQLSTVAAIGILTLMLVVCLSALKFYRGGGGGNEGFWVRVAAPALGAVGLMAILTTMVANVSGLKLAGIVAAAGLVGLAWGGVLGRRPEIRRCVGRGEPEPLAELEHQLSGLRV
jgi:amino acid transporter